MSTTEPAILPTAIHAESYDRMKGRRWQKVERIVNETFALLRQFADEQKLLDVFPSLCGPWHFYISWDEEEGLVIFFSPRRANEHQRIYATDISKHSIISIGGMKDSLSKEHGFSPVYHIQFMPWESGTFRKAMKYARVKALEAISTITQDAARPGKYSDMDFSFPFVDHDVHPGLVFVLMPFSEKWSDRIWNKHLKRIIASCGLEPQRADDLNGINVINDIWQSIARADIVVADLTGMNHNVYYELGLAHALRKKTVLLSQNLDDIPFDLRPYRHIFYEDNSDGYEVLERMLTKVLTALAEG